MTQIEAIRRPWSSDDKRKLIEYWAKFGSITVISILLNRPEGSVQTEASRLDLPRRSEEGDRHRKKWTTEEIALLERSVDDCTDAEGRIRIVDVANHTGRSIDAVAARLQKTLGKDVFRDAIVLPDDLDSIVIPDKPAGAPGAPVVPIDSRKLHKMRDCMCCRNPFYSEGAHHRICKKCRSDDEVLDWE